MNQNCAERERYINNRNNDGNKITNPNGWHGMARHEGIGKRALEKSVVDHDDIHDRIDKHTHTHTFTIYHTRTHRLSTQHSTKPASTRTFTQLIRSPINAHRAHNYTWASWKSRRKKLMQNVIKSLCRCGCANVAAMHWYCAVCMENTIPYTRVARCNLASLHSHRGVFSCIVDDVDDGLLGPSGVTLCPSMPT